MYADILRHRLKEMREIKGLTQDTIARELKVSQGTYNNWETGRRTPELQTILKLADYYDIQLDYLFGRDIEMHKRLKNS